MRIDPSEVIDRFSSMKIVVVGDALLDRYLEGERLRFSREAPVPNVTVARQLDRAGGAANAAANLRALGAGVEFVAPVGGDEAGERLRKLMLAQGIGVSGLAVEFGRRTLAKHRVLAEGQLLLSFDNGDTHEASEQTSRTLANAVEAHARGCDALVVADYGYGALSAQLIRSLSGMQAQQRRLAVIDSRHRLAAFAALRPRAVKPNYPEVAELLGMDVLAGFERRADAVSANASSLLQRTGADLVAATLDRDGAVLIEAQRRPLRVFARPVQARNVAGAGDTFIATLALALATGAPSALAGELAGAAAAIAVSKPGTAVCTAEELRASFAPHAKVVPALEQLQHEVAQYHAQGRRIVFTNGCFDILHRGHVALLDQAKTLGDILIVAVNSDAGIRRLKGPARPINTLEDRLQVLAALGCVDHVVGFEEDTCSHLVRALRPHVFVKGGDYTRDALPEAEAVDAVGGEVHVLPYLSDRSTTGLIQRIHERATGQASAEARG